MHFNYLNKAADENFFFRSLFEKRIQGNSVYKEPCILKKKMKSDMKLNSEHFIELATLEINVICRMQYFF